MKTFIVSASLAVFLLISCKARKNESDSGVKGDVAVANYNSKQQVLFPAFLRTDAGSIEYLCWRECPNPNTAENVQNNINSTIACPNGTLYAERMDFFAWEKVAPDLRKKLNRSGAVFYDARTKDEDDAKIIQQIRKIESSKTPWPAIIPETPLYKACMNGVVQETKTCWIESYQSRNGGNYFQVHYSKFVGDNFIEGGDAVYSCRVAIEKLDALIASGICTKALNTCG